MIFEVPRTPGDLRCHLFLGHGVWAEDERSKAGLIEAHRICHEEMEFGRPIPHTHGRATGGTPSPSARRPVPRAGGGL